MEEDQKKQGPQPNIPQAINIVKSFSGKGLGKRIVIQGGARAMTFLFANPWGLAVLGVIAAIIIATFIIVGFSGAPGHPGEENATTNSIPTEIPTPTETPSPTPILTPPIEP